MLSRMSLVAVVAVLMAGYPLSQASWAQANPSRDTATESTKTTSETVSSRAAVMPRPNGVWLQGGYTDVDQGTPGAAFSGDLVNLVGGYDRFVTERLLLGVALSYESLDIDTRFLTGGGSLENSGYGIAPYIGYRLNDTWSADLVVGYNWLDYDSKVDNNTASGSFDAERWFANTSVNAIFRSDNWRFLPKVGLLYMKETQDAYRQSNGVNVAEADIRLGRVYAGGRIGYATETMMPYIKLIGEYDFKRPGAQAIGNGQFTSDDDTGAQIGAGIEFFSTGPYSGAVEVSYNSAFREDLDVWNALARIRMAF